MPDAPRSNRPSPLRFYTARAKALFRHCLTLIREARRTDPPKARLVILEHGNPMFSEALALDEFGGVVLSSEPKSIHLGPGVLRQLVRYAPRLRGLAGKDLRLAYLVACLKCMGATVVVTFIDNSILFYYLSRECRDVAFCSVQNGIRFDNIYQMDGGPVEPFVAPVTYLCFGDRDARVRTRGPVGMERIKVVGSVLSSHYRSRRRDVQVPRYDVCFVSQWREQEALPLGNTLVERLTELAGFVRRASEELDLTVCVAAVTADTQRERTFFESVLGPKAVFCFRNTTEPSTYRLMDASRVVVGLNSTCLYESLSWGKKTILCNFVDDRSQHCSIEAFWVLKETERSYEVVRDALRKLIAADEADFAQRARAAAREYMADDPAHPAHEVIKAHIRDLLEQPRQ